MVKRNLDLRGADGFDEKRIFTTIGFDEVLIRGPKNGGYEARESRATAEVGPTPGRGWGVLKQLRRIEDVPAPDVGQAISAYQVYTLQPPGEQRHKFLETLQLLGGDAQFVAKFLGPVSAPLWVAFHVKRRRRLCRCACAQALDVSQQGRQCRRGDP